MIRVRLSGDLRMQLTFWGATAWRDGDPVMRAANLAAVAFSGVLLLESLPALAQPDPFPRQPAPESPSAVPKPPAETAPATRGGSRPEEAGHGTASADGATVKPAPAPPEDPKLREAKELFHKGNRLRKAGDCGRALEFYLESRGLVPSVPNTLNAAFCLTELERFDEALEMYETALVEFGDEMNESQRASMGPQIQALRPKIGSLSVLANVSGILVIDGRQRGTLPLAGPVRVLPGERTVRIMKDGYETFEKTVEVQAGKTHTVDARLKPLASSGRLRVEVAGAEGAELSVDGAAVGMVPWEGTLAPGPHVYVVERGDLGTGPQPITVLQGQTVLARPKLAPLGQAIRITVEPPGTEFTLNGVPLGNSWQGRLTVGQHRLEAKQEGYFPETRELSITKTSAQDVLVKLRVNPDHPRWAKPDPWLFWVEGYGGYGLGPSLGSGAEACDSFECSRQGPAHGFLVGARAAYEFPMHLALELGGGYVALTSKVKREIPQALGDADTGEPGTWSIEDSIRFSGPFVSGGLSYRLGVGETVALSARAHIGVIFSSTKDEMTATYAVDDASAAAPSSADGWVPGSGTSARAATLFVLPQIGAELRLGAWRAGLGVCALYVPVDGPDNEHGGATPSVSGECDGAECVSDNPDTVGERAHGSFFSVLPVLSFGYTL